MKWNETYCIDVYIAVCVGVSIYTKFGCGVMCGFSAPSWLKSSRPPPLAFSALTGSTSSAGKGYRLGGWASHSWLFVPPVREKTIYAFQHFFDVHWHPILIIAIMNHWGRPTTMKHHSEWKALVFPLSKSIYSRLFFSSHPKLVSDSFQTDCLLYYDGLPIIGSLFRNRAWSWKTLNS